MQKLTNTYIHLYLPFLLVLFSGCASYSLDKAQVSLRDDFSNKNFESATAELDRSENEEIYKEKDQVLLNLERGMVNHFSGNYRESNQYFSEAELGIEDNFTRSISRGVQSMIVSDNSLVYGGEDYEDVYINVFKSLNFIHQRNYEAALVEARRITFKLEGIEARNRGLADMFAKSDSVAEAEWKPGNRVVENSALGHYLSAVLFAKTGQIDNSRIETERTFRAIDDQQKAFDFSSPPSKDIKKVQYGNEYNLLITGFSGRSPTKVQNDVRLFVGKYSTYVKLSLPSLKLYNSSVNRIEVVVNDSLTIPTFVIEEMDKVAADVYNVKEPIIYARSFTRSLIKATGSTLATKEAHKQSEGLGFITWLAGVIGQEISEKADLRSWQTLPGKAHVNVAKLPPGTHTLTINYYSSQNRLLYSEDQTVDVGSSNSLSLVESLYWH
ncbi:MAG: hypothetical protein WD381_01430 [Balneolaceae bacterium]